jgi:stage II sporulation protein D
VIRRRGLVALLIVVACATGRPGRRDGEGAPATPSPAPRAAPAPQPAPDLPPPLPPPDVAATPVAATPPVLAPSDPLELLWSHRLHFAAAGEPLVTIRLMEGQGEIAFRPRGPARVILRGGAAVEVPAGARLRARLVSSQAAELVHAPLLAEAAVTERERIEATRREAEARGIPTRSKIVGGLYGLGGRVVDNRRELLLGPHRPPGGRGVLHPELVARPRGRIALLAEGGAPLGEADTVIVLEVEDDAGFSVEGVHHALSGAAAREDRRYRGRLFLTVDSGGGLAAVNALPLEALLRGLVPSEMPASSHLEALKAQAVTARSNVLAQIGTRHLTDPYLLCAEVHCQAYRGEGAHHARTDEAVRATAGEAMFGPIDRRLVDGVYSATCGGHGEDNEKVWGNAPNASLRGRPDVPGGDSVPWARDLADEDRLRPFLAEPPDAFCRAPAAARNFRWTRRFEDAALDRLVADLKVGHVRSLEVTRRGVSGRARTLRVTGDAGRAEVQGELRIRRLLQNLPSAMFVVDRAGGAWRLHGGGWGHGAGMCQWGAVGRAQRGHGYRDILRAYFSGAEVAEIY